MTGHLLILSFFRRKLFFFWWVRWEPTKCSSCTAIALTGIVHAWSFQIAFMWRHSRSVWVTVRKQAILET